MGLVFKATNENLDAIVAGLDLEPTDDVLAICGSGDQAFAILEYAHSVLAVDNQPGQVRFAKERKNALFDGDYKHFLFPQGIVHGDYYVNKRNKYFRKPERLDLIKSKIRRAKFSVKDITKVPNLGRFSKFYFSNAIGYTGFQDPETRFIRRLVVETPVGSLIYCSDDRDARYILQCRPPKHVWELSEAQELTRLACQITNSNGGGWKPIVFRKIRKGGK